MENPCLCCCRLSEREEPRAGEWLTEPVFFLIILLASKVSRHLSYGRAEMKQLAITNYVPLST